MIRIVTQLEDDIRHKARLLRISLKISIAEHEKAVAKNRSFLDAINEFLDETMLQDSGENGTQEYGNITNAVRFIVFAFGKKEFCVDAVEAALSAVKSDITADKPSLSMALWKMSERGELEIVERGTGRRPTVYRARELKIVRYRRTSSPKA